MSIKKHDDELLSDDILSKALLAESPEEAMKILRDAGVFTSIQCHGYANPVDSISKDKKYKKWWHKKWWQFWKI